MSLWDSVVDIGLDIAGDVLGGALGGGGDSGSSGGGAAPFMQAPDPILNGLLDVPEREEQGVQKAQVTALPSGRLKPTGTPEDTGMDMDEARSSAQDGWEQTYEWMDFLLRSRE